MNIFHRALAITFLAAVPAVAQNAGDACTNSSPWTCVDSATILYCDGTSYAEANCAAETVTGAVCGTNSCVGSECGEDTAVCFGSRDNPCIGVATLFDGDNSTDNLMAVPCQGNSACVATSSGETCEALPAGVSLCSPNGTGSYCANDNLVICVNYGSAQAVLPSPGVVDCDSLGLTCGTDPSTSQPGCIERADPACGANGQGACVNNVANFCSDGVVSSTSDCSNSGQACVDGSGSPRCVTPDAECGALGLGSCSGTTATICVDAEFQNTTDCSAIGRRCGAVDSSGQIGCIASGGGGEGEGEGEPECENDSDCDDNETCDDGECKRERSRGTTDDEEAPAGLFGCSSSGGAMFPMAAVLAMVLRRRRRA